MNIDKRKKYFIGLDTETCNGIMIDDKLDLSYSLVYDIGWVVCDKKGNIYLERSFVVYDVFYGYKDIMRSAYYAEKIPKYMEEIKQGKRIVKTFYEIRKQFLQDISDYNITTCFAHNMSFDLNALNITQRYLTKSKYKYFFPYNMELWDTLKMSDVIARQKMYIEWCKDNGYMTKHKTPRPRKTVEILYRYLSGEEEFDEEHTGLEDVKIEVMIFAECFKKHKPMQKLLYAA